MSDVKKRDDRPRPKLFPFIIAWTLGCFLASWPVMLLVAKLAIADNNDWPVFFLLLGLGLFATTATVQFYVILRFLKVELLSWIPLSLAGVVIGIFAVRLLSLSTTLPLSPRLLYAGFFFLLWGMPAVFQWMLLRKLFLYHGLWLLAAVVTGPVYSFLLTGDDGPGGVLWTQVLSLLPYPDSILWSTAGLAALFTIPTVILGLILYVVVTQGGKEDALDQSADSSGDVIADDSVFWLLGR